MLALIIIGWAVLLGMVILFNYGAHHNDPIEYED